jgi:hypothetical protein
VSLIASSSSQLNKSVYPVVYYLVRPETTSERLLGRWPSAPGDLRNAPYVALTMLAPILVDG